VNEEILYGIHPVREALAAGQRKVSAVYVAAGASGRAVDEVREAAVARGVSVSRVEADFWKSRKLLRHPVAARVSPLPERELHDLLEAARASGRPGLILVCDQVEDPQNLGALARSALCAGAHGLVLARRRAAPLSPAAVKASAGALEHLPVARVPNLVRAVETLKEEGYWIFGADAEADATLWEADFTGPSVLCLGGEGRGLSRLLAEHCDRVVCIPQSGPVTSLNASAAGSVILFEAARQRQNEKAKPEKG